MEYVGCHVEQKWKPIGIELGLEIETLGCIGYNAQDSSSCMRKVFDEWQKRMSKPYTWQTILTALIMPQVLEKDWAENTVKILRSTK